VRVRPPSINAPRFLYRTHNGRKGFLDLFRFVLDQCVLDNGKKQDDMENRLSDEPCKRAYCSDFGKYTLNSSSKTTSLSPWPR